MSLSDLAQPAAESASSGAVAGSAGYLLALESSCDETAAAVIDDRRRVLSNVVASQFELHRRFGGVVPEMASRAHVQQILPVIDEALQKAGIRLNDLTAIAVATTPGLVGSLLIGLTAAKTLAWSLGIPLVAIDHLQAHIYACQLALRETQAADVSIYPCVGMVVSGGHSNLYACASPVDFELLGATTDDAAGEAFDKVAKVLDLGFPGGPAIEQAAKLGKSNAFAFPRTFLNEERLDFSFSGLKTAVLYAAMGIHGARVQPPPLDDARRADLAASFQAAVVDILVAKAVQALKRTGYKSLCVGGGVAANQAFREKLEQAARKSRFTLHVAPREYCTDNAAMGGLGWELVERGRFAPLDLDVIPGLIRTPTAR